MKYIVNYNTHNGPGVHDENFAFCFSDYNDAIDYINKCTTVAGDQINTVSEVGEDKYVAKLSNGCTANISIKEYPNAVVRYDLVKFYYDTRVEVRRFTKLSDAVKKANALIDADPELSSSISIADRDAANHIYAWFGSPVTYYIYITVLTQERTSSDYNFLGIKDSATPNEVNHAYRELAKKYHPDRGGDSKKFAQLNEAYERIKFGKPQKSSPKLLHNYKCVDLRYVFKQQRRVDALFTPANSSPSSSYNNYSSSNSYSSSDYGSSKSSSYNHTVKHEIRAAGCRIMAKGVFCFVVCLLLAFIADNINRHIAIYLFMASIYGIYIFFKGLAFACFPRMAYDFFIMMHGKDGS